MTASHKYISSTVKRLTQKGLANSSAWLVPKGHILYSMYATLGKARINTVAVATNQAIAAIHPNPAEIDKEYLYYYLSSIEGLIHRFTSQTTQSNLNATIVREFRIALPDSLSRQRKIAKILTTVDNLIEKTEALIAKYQAIKQGMMHDLFTRGVDEHGHLRATYDEAPELYKESELGWIPKEWEVERFGDFVSHMDSGWSPVCESIPVSQGECGSLKTTAISWDGYDPNENKRLPDNLSPKPSAFAKKHDILITRVGPRNRIGIVSHVCETPDQLMISDNMLRLRLVDYETILPAFVPLALASHAIQTRWDGQKVGLAEAQMVITQHVVRNTLIPVPSIDEQERIVFRHLTFGGLMRAEHSYLKKLRTAKTGLMQDLLTGKVRVNVDEGAEDV